jgi:hypothetical protein
MQPFMKMKKKISMTESTRKALNKAIDLLHRLSSKKITEEVCLKEINLTLSNHFLEDGKVNADQKIRLEMCLKEASEVVDHLEKGKIPLYEAIMLINRVVVNHTNIELEELHEEREEPLQFKPKVEPYKQDSDFVSQEFDISGDQREKILKQHFFQKLQEKEDRIEEMKLSQKESLNSDTHISEIKELNKASDDVVHLMNRVLLNKKQLEDAISDLNGQLNSVGFELRPIQK